MLHYLFAGMCGLVYHIQDTWKREMSKYKIPDTFVEFEHLINSTKPIKEDNIVSCCSCGSRNEKEFHNKVKMLNANNMIKKVLFFCTKCIDEETISFINEMSGIILFGLLTPYQIVHIKEIYYSGQYEKIIDEIKRNREG